MLKGEILKMRGITLIDNADFAFVDIAQFHDISFGTLAYSDNMVGLADCLTEFPCVNLCVYPVVELRMTHEDEVVDGDNTLDAAMSDAYRQFA